MSPLHSSRSHLPGALLGQVTHEAPDCIDALFYHAYGIDAASIEQVVRDVRKRHAFLAVIMEWEHPRLLPYPAMRPKRSACAPF